MRRFRQSLRIPRCCQADSALSRFIACVLILTAQLHASAQVAGTAVPLTLADYVAEMDRLAEFLRTSTPAGATDLSRSVSPRWIVDTGSERVAVDTQWLVDGLRQATDPGNPWNANRERFRRRLLEMRAHATEAAGRAHGLAHRSVRSAVQDVLTRPEFQQTATTHWRDRLQQRFGEWVESILDRLGIDGRSGRTLATAFAWVAGIAALGGLGIWLARALAAGTRAVSFGLAHGERTRLSGREWALRALSALRAGDAREAIRLAYNGSLRRMEEQGAWRLDQSRPPREYLRMLEPGDRRRAAVEDLTELFEGVWYGNRAIEGTDSHRVSANLERLGCLHPGDRAI